MLRTRQAAGKGVAFTALILTGYLAGAASKVAAISTGHPLAPVFWLYAFNAFSVGVNVALQWRYAVREPRSSESICAAFSGISRAWSPRSRLTSACCSRVRRTRSIRRTRGPHLSCARAAIGDARRRPQV